MLRAAAVCAAVCAMTFSLATGAAAKDVVPIGKTVGIEIDAEGLIVSGLAGVETASGEAHPASDAGIESGDIIVRLGERDVRSASDFTDAVGELDGSPVTVTLRRADRLIQYTVTPAMSTEGVWRLGLWLRDGISGIGTLTYYDPDTGAYGALGHGVSDSPNGTLLPVSDGRITAATVADVLRGTAGSAGELRGCFDSDRVLGSIELNTVCGIFGRMDAAPSGTAVTCAANDEIYDGAAVIMANISGSECETYDIQVARSAKTGENRLLITVTDPELLAATGGIVQGMSGCPILQNGKLIGAVTHVLLSDPTRGYGITIESMLAAEQSALNDAA